MQQQVTVAVMERSKTPTPTPTATRMTSKSFLELSVVSFDVTGVAVVVVVFDDDDDDEDDDSVLHIKLPTFSHSSEIGLNTASFAQEPLESDLPLVHTIKPVQLATVGSGRRVLRVLRYGMHGSGDDVVVVVSGKISYTLTLLSKAPLIFRLPHLTVRSPGHLILQKSSGFFSHPISAGFHVAHWQSVFLISAKYL